MGQTTGFEPATPRTTTWCSNQLSYVCHKKPLQKRGGELRKNYEAIWLCQAPPAFSVAVNLLLFSMLLSQFTMS